jgi:hypothetical protein
MSKKKIVNPLQNKNKTMSNRCLRGSCCFFERCNYSCSLRGWSILNIVGRGFKICLKRK